MPGKDKTGPQGIGPTGRGMGGCVNASQTQFGKGFKRGCCNKGFGGGCRQSMTEQEEKSFLQSEITAMEKRLEALNKSEN